MNRFLRVLFSALFLATTFAAQGQNIGISNGRPALTTDAFGNAPRANLGYAAPQMVPVCNNTGVAGALGLNTAAQQTSFRRVLYCPGGFKSLQLVLTGFYSAPAETDLSWPLPINLGVETYVAPPWLATTAYKIGDQVSWAGFQYTAAVASTGSMPSASNANWTSLATSKIVAVTCGGSRTCTIPTLTTPGGATVTQSIYKTDVLPVSCTAACWIAVDGWTNQTTGQQYALGRPANMWTGEWWSQGASKTDLSLVGGPTTPQSAMYSPFIIGAAIGIPNDNRPTVCLVGDSLFDGIAGQGLYAGTGVTAGGSGYIASDVGKVTTFNNAGASGPFSYVSAQAIITTVSGGAVTQATPIDAGDYSGTGTGIVMPSGAQTLTGGGTAGNGAQITPFVVGGYDFGDNFNGKGYGQRGLNAAGIPWVSVSRSGDSLGLWINRRYSRMAFIQAVGCRDIILELGINDAPTQSAATIEAERVTLANEFWALGTVKGVYQITMLPTATSLTGYIDYAGQTVGANDAKRIAVNDWTRTNPAPFSGYFETADTVEASASGLTRNGGLWLADGTQCHVMCDVTGFHPTRYGHALAAVPITNNIAILH